LDRWSPCARIAAQPSAARFDHKLTKKRHAGRLPERLGGPTVSVMIRFNLALIAVLASVMSVACGGSQTPAKDPTAADPNAAQAPQQPPPGAQPPGLGLGGTGSGSAQGSGNMGH
jgi:hypothetical protein